MKLFKTRLRSAIAVVQAAVLTAAAVLCTPVTALADKPVSKTYFDTSFEAGDPMMTESIPDGQRVKNVTSVQRTDRLTGDLTCLVRSDTLSGSPDYKAEEGKHNLFDYNTNSKFLTGVKPSAAQPVEVVFELERAAAAVSYLIASGNDEPGRDPTDWTLYGSADGNDYVQLDAQSGITFSARQEKKTFQFENTTAYRYYKLTVTKNNGDSMTQFSELQLADSEQSGETADITDLVDLNTLAGSADFVAGESKSKLFDHNTWTKFLTGKQPGDSDPVEVSFSLTRPAAVGSYLIGAGPDEMGRNPKSWVFYGSADGESWNELDRQSGVVFGREQETRRYTTANTAEYKHYKLIITENNGAPMTQFSELQIFAASGNEAEALPYMTASKSRGPSESFNTLTSTGWTGWSALEVLGKHTGEGEAYCYNVIYDDLAIPVTANTNLSYVFFPALWDKNVYDYDYTSQHMAVDLKFTDGSYLSELNAADQNGNAVSPKAQGESGVLAYMQWNHIYSNIGAVAEGKTIEKILVGYHKGSNTSGSDAVFLGYFDDITIEDSEPIVYEHLSDYVNILRGTNNTLMYSRGITTPLVTLPNGFNGFAPVTESGSTLPYYYQLAGNKTTLRHISIEHTASPWLGDWGTWQFMPNTDIDYGTVTKGEDIGADRRAADFTHEKETAKAHYYGVTFEEGSAASGVKMEITPTMHGVYARFTFPKESDNRNLIFDCERADGGLKFHGDGSFTAYSDDIYGYDSLNYNQANGATRMYIYGVIDQAYDAAKVVNGKQGIISFTESVNTVTMKLATSFISEEQAKKNLELEIGGNDTFDTVFDRAQKVWDEKLGMIEVEGASYDQLVTLYSNIYRMSIYPIFYSENSGTAENEKWVYASPYGGTATAPEVREGKLYTINGFWDTYRSAWPAYTLLTPEKTGEMLDGLLLHYKDSGWISRWLAPAAVNCMLGTSIDSIFGDAMTKGIKFDYESAFDASLKNSAVVSGNLNLGGRIETSSAIFRGYTSTNVHEGFSWGMEDSLNDFNIYKMAEALGRTDEAAYYKNRALNYTNYFNSELGWYMARNADGSFRYDSLEDFDPSAWHNDAHWDYCETNGWNMIFSAVQDVQGMINLYGGEEKALERLDGLFGADLRGEPVGMQEMREVRLGQYNHTNEPSLHLAYIYAYLGRPYRTQEIVRDVLARCYSGSSIGQGYLGDEDNGEMSAWYVLNALGFYPAAVGNSEYIIGSPLYTKATVHLDNGNTLVISAPDNSKENIYVQSVKLNGKEHTKTYFTYDELVSGGVIDFEMGDAPSGWGAGKDSRPTSLTEDDAIPAPLTDITADAEIGCAQDVSGLFDDTSDTKAVLTGGEKEIIIRTPEAKAVSMYTMTCGADNKKAPAEFALYGSTDGENWTLLDERKSVEFQWAKYTRPFALALEKQGVYGYYKLTFAGETDIELAQIEFIGCAESAGADKAELKALYDEYKSARQEDYTPDSWADFSTAMGVAKDVLANENASGSAVNTALQNLKAAVGRLETALIVGDVDMNGTVNVADMIMLKSLIMNGKWSDRDLAAGDIDKNGTLNVSDMLAIKNIIMQG